MITDTSLFALLFAAGGSSSGFGFINLLPILAMFGIIYFLMIRPQSQMQRRLAEMRSNLSKNDKVIACGGIHGIITGLTPKTVTVKVADGVSIKLERTSIDTVLSEKNKEDSEKKTEDEEENEEES